MKKILQIYRQAMKLSQVIDQLEHQLGISTTISQRAYNTRRAAPKPQMRPQLQYLGDKEAPSSSSKSRRRSPTKQAPISPLRPGLRRSLVMPASSELGEIGDANGESSSASNLPGISSGRHLDVCFLFERNLK